MSIDRGVLAEAVRTVDLTPPPASEQSGGVLVRGLVPLRDQVLPVVREMCAQLAADGLPAETGCFVGAQWSGELAARRIRETVEGPGWRWIDPEAFLYYSPHALAADICIEAGLRGPCLTFVGDDAAEQARWFGELECGSGNCRTSLVLRLDLVVSSAEKAEHPVVRLAATLLSAAGTDAVGTVADV